MPETSVIWLRLAVLLYGVGLFDAILCILNRRAESSRVAQLCFQTAAVLHFVSIAEHSFVLRHLAANNFFETASLCALLFAVMYLFIQWRYQFVGLNLIAYPAVFTLALVSSMGSPVASWSDPRVRNAWLLAHIILVLIGYTGLVLSASAAMFYLVQERRLKSKQPLSSRLPPLEVLDSLITTSMSVGLVAVTLAVIVGSTWAFIESGTKWIGEPKIAVSFVTWFVYLLMVFLRVSAGWRGRRAAFAALIVLGFGALTWAAHIGLRPLLER